MQLGCFINFLTFLYDGKLFQDHFTEKQIEAIVSGFVFKNLKFVNEK